MMFKRILAVVLACALCACALCGCGEEEVKNREYNEEEVRSAARTLIEKSALLNEIYWGAGIPYKDDLNLASGKYFPADEIYLEKIGISTIEDLKNLTRGTFSDEMCSWVFSTLLSSISDGTTVAATARYAQMWGGADGKTPEYILVYSETDYFLVDKVTYHLDTIKVLGSKGEKVNVEILVTVISSDEKNPPMDKTIDVSLIEEEDGWRLDSPTYTRYY